MQGVSVKTTMLDVAKALGVSKATVSRALHNGSRISSATKQRILETAKKMGYRIDPIFSAFARNRWHESPVQTSCSLGIVIHAKRPVAECCKESYIQHAKQTAEKIGYPLEVYNIRDYASGEHMSHIMYSSGVRGIMIGYVNVSQRIPDLEWDLFSLISLDENPFTPPVHRVEMQYSHITQLAWEKTIEAGYRKIGAAFYVHAPVTFSDHQRLGASLDAQQRHLKPSEHIPCFLYNESNYEKTLAQFADWFKKYRPEVVIGWHEFIAILIKGIGKRIPEDVAFVSLTATDSNTAGVLECYSLLYEKAVQFLDRLIRTNERGIPEKREILTFTGEWQDGPSLPRKV